MPRSVNVCPRNRVRYNDNNSRLGVSLPSCEGTHAIRKIGRGQQHDPPHRKAGIIATMLAFDTHAAVKRLQKAGADESLAEAVVSTFG